MKKLNLHSQGSALLNAIIVAGIVAGVAAIVMNQTQVTDKSSRGPRIKSAMTVLETQMLSLAMQPGIYQNCSQQAQNCHLSESAAMAFQNLNRPVAGAACPGSRTYPGKSNSTPTSCGVKVQAASSLACLNSKNPNFNASCLAGRFYNPATQTFCAEIIYQGSEAPMQPVCASTTVPQSVLQGTATACNSAANLTGPYPKVIFRGYDSAGNAVCSPIPSCIGGNVAMAGNYITSIDKLSLQTQCKALGSGFLSCPSGSIISSLQWGNVSNAFGTLSASTNCMPRRTPSDTHLIAGAPPITVPPGTYTPTTTLRGGGGGGPPPSITLPFCPPCKSGAGYCGNPPACTMCVVNRPVNCGMPVTDNIPTNCRDDDPCTSEGEIHQDHGQACICAFLGGNPHPEGYGVCHQQADGSWSLTLVRTGSGRNLFCK